MKQTDSIIEGFRRLLYGGWSPAAVSQQYEHTDDHLFEELWELPASPEAYLSASEDIDQRWRQQLDDISRKWEPPFYALPENDPEPFHPLCKFYRSVILCESRMIIHLTSSWVQSLELTLLKYELVTLQQGLVVLLKECDSRLKERNTNGQNLEENLEAYLLTLLYNQLLMLLLELADRFLHLLEERVITLEELYLKWLHRPVAEQHSWYHTETYYDFYLEKCLREEGRLDHIEDLLWQAYKDDGELDTGQEQQSVGKSIRRLENVLLCYVVGVETDQLEAYDLVDRENNSRLITDWIAMLDDRKRHDESFRLHHLLRRMGYCRDIISLPGANSEAAQLLKKLEGIFDPSAGSGGFIESSAEEETTASEPTGTAEHWALQQYISIDEVQEKLGVVPKTLTRYLRKSEAEVIKISQKRSEMP